MMIKLFRPRHGRDIPCNKKYRALGDVKDRLEARCCTTTSKRCTQKKWTSKPKCGNWLQLTQTELKISETHTFSRDSHIEATARFSRATHCQSDRLQKIWFIVYGLTAITTHYNTLSLQDCLIPLHHGLCVSVTASGKDGGSSSQSAATRWLQ